LLFGVASPGDRVGGMTAARDGPSQSCACVLAVGFDDKPGYDGLAQQGPACMIGAATSLRMGRRSWRARWVDHQRLRPVRVRDSCVTASGARRRSVLARLAAAPATAGRRRSTAGVVLDDAVISCVFGPPRGDGTAVGRPRTAARWRRRIRDQRRLRTASGPTRGGWIEPVGGGG